MALIINQVSSIRIINSGIGLDIELSKKDARLLRDALNSEELED